MTRTAKTKTEGNLAVKEPKTVVKQDQIVRETIVKNAMMMGNVMYARIPLHLLDKPAWQRHPNMSNVRKLATHWSEPKAQAIIVSYRDGKFWIIDGQHRVLAAGMKEIQDIFAQIYTGLTAEEEVELFTEQNTHKTAIRAYHRLFAENQIGSNPGKEIFEVLKANKVKFKEYRSVTPGVLSCMHTVEDSYKKIGRAGLDWVFKAIQALQWTEVKDGYSSKVIYALTQLWYKYNETQNMDEVSQKLARVYGRYAPEDVTLQALNTYKGYRQKSALTALLESAITRN